jgi:hypothetical protein
MFFDVKKVLIAVALIVGIMAIVIFGFLRASGIFSFDSRDSLYQGVLDRTYTETTFSGGEPLDATTLEILSDSDHIGATTDSIESGDEDEGAGNQKPDAVRVLLFLGSGELIAKGSVTDGDNTFSLVKTVNFSELKKASDAPHMNRERDMLTYRDVEDALEDGGFFRVESGGKYISKVIVPESPELVR